MKDEHSLHPEALAGVLLGDDHMHGGVGCAKHQQRLPGREDWFSGHF